MPTTIADLVEDWKRSREALQDQVNLMDRDTIFPDATLSPAQRDGLRSQMQLLIARYDELIILYGPASQAVPKEMVSGDRGTRPARLPKSIDTNDRETIQYPEFKDGDGGPGSGG